MKFVLIIWVCSFLGQYTCMPPIQAEKMYNSWYECSRAAHTESKRILGKIGYKEVNDARIGTRYSCNEVPTT
mgnify:FL=1